MPLGSKCCGNAASSLSGWQWSGTLNLRLRPVVECIHYLSSREKCCDVSSSFGPWFNAAVGSNDFLLPPAADLCCLVELIFRGQWGSVEKEKLSLGWSEFSMCWCFMLVNLDGVLICFVNQHQADMGLLWLLMGWHWVQAGSSSPDSTNTAINMNSHKIFTQVSDTLNYTLIYEDSL